MKLQSNSLPKSNKPLEIIKLLISYPFSSTTPSTTPSNNNNNNTDEQLLPEYRDAICDLEPFPEGEPFLDIATKYHQIRGNYTLTGEIRRFLRSTNKSHSTYNNLYSNNNSSNIVKHMSPVTRLSRLNHLKEQLRNNRAELNKV